MPFGMPEYPGPGAQQPAAPPLSTDRGGESSGESAAPVSGNAPSGAAPQGAAPIVSEQPSRTQTTADLVDLDKLEKFIWKGRETTRKEWEDGNLRQQDYSKKTAELAERTKYADNFDADLEKVLADPDKWLHQFERVYPARYVKIAKTLLEGRKPAPQTSVNPNESKAFSVKDDPEFQALRSELDEWKRTNQEAQTQASREWLDSQHESLSKKFPFAHKEIVEARLGAHALKHGGKSVNAKLMNETYEKVNEELKKRAVELTKANITKQINAGKEARDVGAGGDAPTPAPRQPKNMKEAREAMLADIEAQRLANR